MSYYSYENGRGGFMSNTPVAVKNLIIINILVWIMTLVNRSMMVENFALYFPASPFFRFWQPVTHMFMHGGFGHLFFNMYALYIFGSVLERVWGPKKFLLFYFVTGIGAAAVHMGVQWIQYADYVPVMNLMGISPADLNDNMMELSRYGQTNAPTALHGLLGLLGTPTVGASGAIYGVLMGYAMLYPDSVLTLLFPPISMKAKWFVLIFGAIELLVGITGTQQGVAHFAHLGGLIFGFLLIMYWKKKHKLYGSW